MPVIRLCLQRLKPPVILKFVFFILPTLVRGGLVFAILPVSTYYLAVEEFGAFAVFGTLVAFCGGLASAGIGNIHAAHLHIAEEHEAVGLISTTLWLSVAGAIGSALILFFSWHGLTFLLPELALAPAGVEFYGMLIVMLSPLWACAVHVITNYGSAAAYAVIVTSETVVAGLVTVLMLSVFHSGASGLYAGLLAGSVSTAIGAGYFLRPYVSFALERRWVSEIYKVSALSIGTAIAERLLAVVQSAALTTSASLAEVAVFSHGSQYAVLERSVAKAWSNAVWPSSLERAKGDNTEFAEVAAFWYPIHMLIGAAGIFLATVGADLVSFLSHGKFNGAHLWAAALSIVVILEYSSRMSFAVLYANRKSAAHQLIVLSATLIGLVVTVPLINALGAWGAVAATFITVLVYKIAAAYWANKYRRVPFRDWPALIAIAAIAGAIGTADALGAGLIAHAYMFVLQSVAMTVVMSLLWFTTRKKRLA